jgi:RHH-type transcriptional regulator, proline utilization regulon repressor / proline dehydrogenase / delta 1-pyrroline-5-carboxylate dehydrogenase
VPIYTVKSHNGAYSEKPLMKPNDLPTPAAHTHAGPTPARLGDPFRNEAAHAHTLVAQLARARDTLEASRARAHAWIEAIRRKDQPAFAVERLLAQFPISSAEGLALLRLAEALLRIPDVDTAALLATDVFKPVQLAQAEDEDMIARATRKAMQLGQRLLPSDDAQLADSLLSKLGAQTFVRASRAAVAVLSQQFVFAASVEDAVKHARKLDANGLNPTVSFDMLGEGARTQAQAQRYLAAYKKAVEHTAQLPRDAHAPHRGANVSIKLTALHPRFEETHRAHALPELLHVLVPLVQDALARGVPITIDAEESERLEIHLDVMDALFAQCKPAPAMLGLALQAYSVRALDTLDAVALIAKTHHTRAAVRLVKGAYWDAEIKRTQELGLPGYPVFTHKSHTDLSYLAGAAKLFKLADHLYPMFATHNAATLAAVRALAGSSTDYEFQRLHGMGESLYEAAAHDLAVPVRIYAPVGEPRDLLAYLVRRLLENGANTSFVHQLADARVPAQALTELPFTVHTAPALPLPAHQYGAARKNSEGLDVLQRYSMQSALRNIHASFEVKMAEKAHGYCAYASGSIQKIISPADGVVVGSVPLATTQDVHAAYTAAHTAWPAWEALPVTQRADCLRKAADALEAQMHTLLPLLAREAGKTLADGVAEVREAVDFLRYYAHQAEKLMAAQTLPGPTGEDNTLTARGRGVWACISPWNFPLAIFAGQVAAALVTGNCVLAKPAEQTPLIAQHMVGLLHAAGVPRDVLILLAGAGDIGAALTADVRCAGVAFTGSTEVARLIAKSLANRDAPLAPLIAETGGINAMIVDSTALPEQVIDAVITSSARSAGQRCSALRVLAVQEDVADEIIAGIAGALEVLRLGDPLDPATDVGPIIDQEALTRLQKYEAQLSKTAKLIGKTPSPVRAEPFDKAQDKAIEAHLQSAARASTNSARTDVSTGGLSSGHYFAPCAYEVAAITEIKEEVFGPILHIVRYAAKDLDALMHAINGFGYGLTLGIQTRIMGRAQQIAAKLRVGNVYVNRSMIGAVVGVQPFGGQGLSGTGPKAGGPHYLSRFVTEQTVTINTAAAGGNATLLASFSV